MRSASDMLRHPSRMLERASEALHLRQAPRRPMLGAGGGLVALILLVLGIYWLLPEIRRYVRIERM